MNIRIMTIADYDKVYKLWTSCKGMGLNNLDDSEAGIAKYLARNPETCFVAEADGMIVGVILCGHDGRRGYIHHTAVREAYRGRGIGARLVDAALDGLRREGIGKAALVVFAHNEMGNAFWERMGFTQREDLCYRNKTLTEMVRIDT